MKQIDNKSPYWFIVSSYCKKHLAQDEYWQAGLLSEDSDKAVIRVFVDGLDITVIDLTISKRNKKAGKP